MNKRFNQLTKISLVLIYLVIIAGAIVRMTGSGMGCPDWPKCFGYYIPPTEESQLIFKSFHNYNKGEMILLNSENFYTAIKDFKSEELINLSNWNLFQKHDYVAYDPVHTWIEYLNRLIGALAGLLERLQLSFDNFYTNCTWDGISSMAWKNCGGLKFSSIQNNYSYVNGISNSWFNTIINSTNKKSKYIREQII